MNWKTSGGVRSSYFKLQSTYINDLTYEWLDVQCLVIRISSAILAFGIFAGWQVLYRLQEHIWDITSIYISFYVCVCGPTTQATFSYQNTTCMRPSVGSLSCRQTCGSNQSIFISFVKYQKQVLLECCWNTSTYASHIFMLMRGHGHSGWYSLSIGHFAAVNMARGWCSTHFD